MFSTIKSILWGILGIIGSVGLFLFKRKSDKVDELNNEVEVKERELQAKQEQLEVQQEVHRDEVANVLKKVEQEKQEHKLDNEKQKEVEEVTKKVNNPDPTQIYEINI